MRICAVVVALGCLAGCSSPSTAPSPGSTNRGRTRVLMLTATAGFRHDSIAAARDTMTALGATSTDFIVTPTEDLAQVSAANLANYDVLFFALTTGELPLTADQKSAILAFVQGGKGFLGAHSATHTLYEWPEYEALIGARFKEHPWTQLATVLGFRYSVFGTRFSVLGFRYSVFGAKVTESHVSTPDL